MINKNKGFATIAILGIILGVLVIGGGAYYMGVNKNTDKEKMINNQTEKVEENLNTKNNIEVDKESKTVSSEESGKVMEVTLYFGNEIKNPGSHDCSLVYPVKRTIPKTEAVARASLEELIKGPTKEERELGYYGTLPVETKINSINIKDGILSIDFSKEIENNFASCSGNYRLTSINKTMMQFPSVKQIKLGVNGNWNRDEILQP